MYTIRNLCERSGLSRTALLYYESIGLLRAEARSESNYRLYSDDSAERLEKICTYRDAGVPLADIVQILSYESSEEREILERTLHMLNHKAKEIKESQEKIASLLHQAPSVDSPLSGVDVRTILASLAPLGIGEEVFLQIHGAIEHSSPEGHQSLMKFLGFSEDEINRVMSGTRKKSMEVKQNDQKKT
ncbi:MAG: MerR family transcriptional regulator [Clostridiales bacterium]|nr:MerR family transcriptional regulator [Clostridiales bacterium]